MYYKTTESLLAFIKKSPTAFQATAEMEKKFTENGYQLLSEQEYWKLQPGGKYIVTRNHSALIAFSIPKKECRKFHIIASHSDSPAFKIKENPEMRVENAYTKLNVEGYGGMLMAPWFDRPLSVAGRVVVRRDGSLKEELVNIDRDLVMIPSLAIHMNREANKGVSYNPQKDLLPLLGCGDSKPELLNIIAEELKVSTEDILAHDLFLYNRTEGTIWGADREFVSAPRLDDLQCAFASMEGMLAGKHEESIAVHCVLDNEEVGSGTKQGAASTFLKDTLRRINDGLGRTYEEYLMTLAGSFKRRNCHQIQCQPEILYRCGVSGKIQGSLRPGRRKIPDLCESLRCAGRIDPGKYFEYAGTDEYGRYRTSAACNAFSV